MLVWKELFDEMERQFCGEIGNREWCHDCCGENHWTETTEEMHQEQLNVLPPIGWDGTSFLVSEAWSISSQGESIYAGFTKVGDTFYARYMTRKQYREMELPPVKVAA